MQGVNTTINDAHDNFICCRSGQSPGLKETDIGFRRAEKPVHFLTGILKPILPTKLRIIRLA